MRFLLSQRGTPLTRIPMAQLPDIPEDAPQQAPSHSRPKPLSRAPSYLQFAPRRAIESFENLVALANHQERLKEARKIIWRDKGEPVAEVEDIWECIEHAGRGGMRMFWFARDVSLLI